jgi:hypothetical protein
LRTPDEVLSRVREKLSAKGFLVTQTSRSEGRNLYMVYAQKDDYQLVWYVEPGVFGYKDVGVSLLNPPPPVEGGEFRVIGRLDVEDGQVTAVHFDQTKRIPPTGYESVARQLGVDFYRACREAAD